MKRIEKEYTRVEKEVYFEAYDGERFSSAEACKEYENNAKGVIGKKVWEVLVKRANAYALYEPLTWCSEDDPVEIYLPQTMRDIDNLNMYTNMYYKDCKVIDESYIGKHVVVEFNYDKDWCNIRSFDEIIDRLKEHFEKLSGKNPEERN